MNSKVIKHNFTTLAVKKIRNKELCSDGLVPVQKIIWSKFSSTSKNLARDDSQGMCYTYSCFKMKLGTGSYGTHCQEQVQAQQCTCIAQLEMHLGCLTTQYTNKIQIINLETQFKKIKYGRLGTVATPFVSAPVTH